MSAGCSLPATLAEGGNPARRMTGPVTDRKRALLLLLDKTRPTPQTTTLGPNQIAWCRDNLRGFRLDEPVRRANDPR